MTNLPYYRGSHNAGTTVAITAVCESCLHRQCADGMSKISLESIFLKLEMCLGCYTCLG